jgi:hypothetical protein
MKALSNSAFADPKGRRYPITDEAHIISALCAVLRCYANHSQPTSYLQKVHDRILDRAEEIHMKLGHSCTLCAGRQSRLKERVQFD